MAKQGDTGRSRRPAKGDDEGSPAPRKKDSGSNKALKKSSARKSARVGNDDDDAEDEAPRGKKKGSARSASAAPPRAGGQNEQLKKAFLYSTPILIIFLLAVGWKLATMEEPKTTVIVNDPNKDVDIARKKYNEAKDLYNTGHTIEGDAGTAKVRQAQKNLQDASEILQKIREKTEAGPEKNDKGQATYDAYEDLDKDISSLLVLVRKELQMR